MLLDHWHTGCESPAWVLPSCCYIPTGPQLIGLWASPCTQHGRTPLGEHSMCHPQLCKQQRTMAKPKYAMITCWISFHEGLAGCAVSSHIHKTTFSVSCQNYSIHQEGICRKVLASVIHPFGFFMLGNNPNRIVQDHKLHISQGQSFPQCTR